MFLSGIDNTCLPNDLEMGRKRRLADFQCVAKLTNARFSFEENVQYSDPCRIGESLRQQNKVMHLYRTIPIYDFLSRLPDDPMGKLSGNPRPMTRQEFPTMPLQI